MSKKLIKDLLINSSYLELTKYCENAIDSKANVPMYYYWYLGLCYILDNREDEAQAAWLSGISLVPEEESFEYSELVEILNTEAKRQAETNKLDNAWLIRQHIREIAPDNINNLLELILISILTQSFDVNLLAEWNIFNLLSEAPSKTIDPELVSQALINILDFPSEEAIEFLKLSAKHIDNTEIVIDSVTRSAVMRCLKYKQYLYGTKLLETCLEIRPNFLTSLFHLSSFYSEIELHQKALETAHHYYNLSKNIGDKILGSYLIVRALMTAANLVEAQHFAQRHTEIIGTAIDSNSAIIPRIAYRTAIVSSFVYPYLRDSISENRFFQNQVGEFFYRQTLELLSNRQTFIYQNPDIIRQKLKIGYIAHTLSNHSVGWLSRWLFHYHDREQFEIYIYCINQDLEKDFSKKFFRDKVDVAYSLEDDSPKVAELINKDEIDILVDLDSITLDLTCEVMALKPAPIQVTWLGWDASAIPSIDYYIADNYVLPENAQEYYQETIWRMPETYLAVDGFEVGVPSLTREMLNIPPDAIAYLSAQSGYKRHPDTIKLQLRIIREVPHSYLLIKGLGDKNVIQDYFTTLAEEVEVEPSRLRFLERDEDELTHRANLTIADIVLDTYPYNGATTTLEMLWVGIPMVTRVGEQFSARNSYTFMKNAGIEEGIAWTDKEYVEWGVRLGKDKALRWEIAAKLRASRQTSPLWNAKKFTQEMENAYRQMWAKYVGG